MSFEKQFADMTVGELAEIYESLFGGWMRGRNPVKPPSFGEWLASIIETWESSR